MLRVSEVYGSVQGEGPRVGRATVFVRFGGCNLRCPGWPCDTQHAIDPAYRNEWARRESDDLAAEAEFVAWNHGAHLITLTGGEPFLQPKKDLNDFVFRMRQVGYGVEAFSNGTLEYPDWAIDQVHFIMDWKLPGSGENHMNMNRLANLERLKASAHQQAVKFVIKDEDDFYDAHTLWSSYIGEGTNIVTYYGKVWDGDISDAQLAKLVMRHQLPWRMNVQLHNYIWDPQERGR